MRRRIGTWVLLAGSFLALACVSDQNPFPTQPQLSTVAPYPACSSPFATLITSQINTLYPSRPNLRQAALSQFSGVVKQCSKNPLDAQSKAVHLAGFAAKKFLSQQLVNGTPWDAVSVQIDYLYQYVGLPAPGIPAEAVGPNAAVAVVAPTDPPTVIETEGENPAGVSVETGAFSTTQTVLVTITPDPAGTNPFPNTSRFQEFPPFYDFQTFPPLASFNKPVLVGICVDLTEVPFEQAHRLQLAHPRHPDLKDLELLDRVDAAFLPCDSYVHTGSKGFLGRLAARALGLFQPRVLHAAALAPGGLGGQTGNFSDFRAVDPATATTTALTTSAPLAVVGTTLTLTATVSPAPPTSAEATVEFFDGSESLGSATVGAGGIATFTTAELSLAAHSLRAEFAGASGFPPSNSATVTQHMIQRFNTLSGFTAALGGAAVATQDFESFDVGTAVSAVIDDVLNVTSTFANLEVFSSETNVLFGFDGTTREAGNGRYDFAFVSSRNALGFDVISQDPATDPAEFEVVTTVGAVTFLVSNPSESEGDPNFFGIIATVPLGTLIVREGPEVDGEGNEEIAFDSFVVAQVSLP